MLGLARHLRAYVMSPERAALEQLEVAGQVFDMAFRLRGSTTSPGPRVSAIGLEAGLGPMALRVVVLVLEGLGWVSVTRDAQGQPVTVTETIPAPGGLVQAAPRVLEILGVGPVERAALAILRATTVQPLPVEDALASGAAASGVGAGDSAVEAAVRHLAHTGLARRVRAEDGREVLFNPNVWVQSGQDIAAAALRAADARATPEVGALIQELAASPGLPEVLVQSTEQRWVQFAVAQGLVQRSVIQTSEGQEQGFLFTPHHGRDPFGQTAGDASGQVRQLVGSMVYATTFAQYKLRDPALFLTSLISRGVAGNVTSIGTDYPMLEKAGIVRVLPGFGHGRFRMELLQSEVAEDALRFLQVRESAASQYDDVADLRAQRSYVHFEQERAKLALTTSVDEVEQARLIAALRETTSRLGLGARP